MSSAVSELDLPFAVLLPLDRPSKRRGREQICGTSRAARRDVIARARQLRMRVPAAGWVSASVRPECLSLRRHGCEAPDRCLLSSPGVSGRTGAGDDEAIDDCGGVRVDPSRERADPGDDVRYEGAYGQRVWPSSTSAPGINAIADGIEAGSPALLIPSVATSDVQAALPPVAPALDHEGRGD